MSSCCYKKCKTKSSTDRLINCWLCTKVAHIKCCGINAPTADKVSAIDGLHWSCPSCRSLEIDFLKMLTQSRHAFFDMHGHFKK